MIKIEPVTLKGGTAIGVMVAEGEKTIAEVVVMAQSDQLVTPCGGCRQRIREFAAPSTSIHIAGPEGLRRKATMGELLPLAFGPQNLLPEGGKS